jgi:hypothetical protein
MSLKKYKYSPLQILFRKEMETYVYVTEEGGDEGGDEEPCTLLIPLIGTSESALYPIVAFPSVMFRELATQTELQAKNNAR